MSQKRIGFLEQFQYLPTEQYLPYRTDRRKWPEKHTSLRLMQFLPDQKDGHRGVLLIAADVDGTTRMIEFSYNTNISDILDELK